eukprot:3318285-Rhodomonas_salina.1
MPAVWFGDPEEDYTHDPWTPGTLPAYLHVNMYEGMQTKPRVVYGVFTQGGGKWVDKWTTSFQVWYMDDQFQPHWVDGGKVFQGNTDRYGVLEHIFDTLITTNVLEVVPLSGQQGNESIALRIRPHLCPPSTTPPDEQCSQALVQTCSQETEQGIPDQANTTQSLDTTLSDEHMQNCLILAGCSTRHRDTGPDAFFPTS